MTIEITALFRRYTYSLRRMISATKVSGKLLFSLGSGVVSSSWTLASFNLKYSGPSWVMWRQ